MPALTIYLHADNAPTFETSDPAIVEAVRSSLAPVSSQLVMAHELARLLRSHRKHWASVLANEEAAHMVRVVIA